MKARKVRSRNKIHVFQISWLHFWYCNILLFRTNKVSCSTIMNCVILQILDRPIFTFHLFWKYFLSFLNILVKGNRKETNGAHVLLLHPISGSIIGLLWFVWPCVSWHWESFCMQSIFSLRRSDLYHSNLEIGLSPYVHLSEWNIISNPLQLVLSSYAAYNLSKGALGQVGISLATGDFHHARLVHRRKWPDILSTQLMSLIICHSQNVLVAHACFSRVWQSAVKLKQ